MEHAATIRDWFFHSLGETLAHYGVDPVPAIDALLGSIVLIVVAFFLGIPFRRSEYMRPEGTAGINFVIRYALRGMYNFFDSMLKGGVGRLYPLLATFVFFILVNNIIGLVPGMESPTSQFNVTIVLALVTFAVAHAMGIKAHGFGYVKKFMGPVWWLAPLIMPIEIISHLVRPVSLSVRLFGNLTGDHKVIVLFSSLLPLFLPLPFIGLGIFVSVLQTFVFVLLSCVYFQDALEEAH